MAAFRTLLGVLSVLLIGDFASAAPETAAALRKRVNAMVAPDRISQVTLSPDGAHVAYVVRDGTVASVVVRAVDPPYGAETVRAAADEKTGILMRTINFRVRIPFVAWANSQALVYVVSLPPRGQPLNEELSVVGIDGRNGRKLLDSDALEILFSPPEPPPSDNPDAPPPEPPPLIPIRRPMRVLGFDGNAVLVEALGNVRAETTVYRIDLTTGVRAQVTAEEGAYRNLYDVHGQPRVRETPRLRPPPLLPPSRHGPRMPEETAVLRQQFEYRAAGGGRWRNLDQLGGTAGKLRFAHDDDDHYEPRTIPLALDAANVLYCASNVGRDTFALYGIDLASGARTAFAVESDSVDLADPEDVFRERALVFDRERRLVGVRRPDLPGHILWLDPAVSRLQTTADRRFAGRVVRILDWSDAKTRALLLVSGPADPGRYFILDYGAAPQFTELLRRVPNLAADQVERAEAFAFTTPAGVRLTGSIVVPARSRVTPPPLVVVCQDVPGRAPEPAGYHRDAQALAAQGFLVLQVNHRGSAGFGRQFRDAVKSGFDRVPLQDVQDAIAWLAKEHPFDRRRVAIMGQGYGGFLALRALELFPGQFRCAVAIDAPVDVARWALDVGVQPVQSAFGTRRPPSERLAHRRAFFTANSREVDALKSVSVLRDVARLQPPVLILDRRERPFEAWPQGDLLRTSLRKLGRDPQYATIPDAFAAGDAENAGRTLERIGDFLNGSFFEYTVRIGPERQVDDPEPVPPAATPEPAPDR